MQSLLVIAFLVGAHAAEKACNGLEVDKPTGTDNPINEPCYVHDGQCEGYAVCCVKYGTCTATVQTASLPLDTSPTQQHAQNVVNKSLRTRTRNCGTRTSSNTIRPKRDCTVARAAF